MAAECQAAIRVHAYSDGQAAADGSVSRGPWGQASARAQVHYDVLTKISLVLDRKAH
jgi:hypothetical protein